ncbi:hypothetical protein VTH82DRAFT_7170 [Thermothelomyces myriococcoides]
MTTDSSFLEAGRQPKPNLIPGIEPPENGTVYNVGWVDGDPENPQSWSPTKKWWVTAAVCLISIPVSIFRLRLMPRFPRNFSEEYGVGPIAGFLTTEYGVRTTGMYLIGSGVRSMFAAPFLETFGRNWVYFSTLTIFILFCLGMAIAPNYSAAIVFRFLVGFLAAAPLTVGGDTIADIRSLLEITFSLLFMTMTSYAGPILCPIIGAYLSILASARDLGPALLDCWRSTCISPPVISATRCLITLRPARSVGACSTTTCAYHP